MSQTCLIGVRSGNSGGQRRPCTSYGTYWLMRAILTLWQLNTEIAFWQQTKCVICEGGDNTTVLFWCFKLTLLHCPGWSDCPFILKLLWNVVTGLPNRLIRTPTK
ncbi:UNVERIFIED_CONTAM: hypothetical protein NCL1_36360 [Trichonephila clavipes]